MDFSVLISYKLTLEIAEKISRIALSLIRTSFLFFSMN